MTFVLKFFITLRFDENFSQLFSVFQRLFTISLLRSHFAENRSNYQKQLKIPFKIQNLDHINCRHHGVKCQTSNNGSVPKIQSASFFVKRGREQTATAIAAASATTVTTSLRICRWTGAGRLEARKPWLFWLG